MSREDEYWAWVCEKDTTWKIYCSCPTEKTWAMYEAACASEKAAVQMLALDELYLCGCGQVVKIGKSCEYGCAAETARQ